MDHMLVEQISLEHLVRVKTKYSFIVQTMEG